MFVTNIQFALRALRRDFWSFFLGHIWHLPFFFRYFTLICLRSHFKIKCHCSTQIKTSRKLRSLLPILSDWHAADNKSLFCFGTNKHLFFFGTCFFVSSTRKCFRLGITVQTTVKLLLLRVSIISTHVNYGPHAIFLSELFRGPTSFFTTAAPKLTATLSPSLPKYGIAL